MKEQSDTPRTDATQYQWTRTLDLARDLERELATATRERDAAIREIGEQARLLGMSGSREMALLAQVDSITRERDEARALNVEWSKKAETWMASPEAAQRLQGYRELGQQVAKAQNERDEARAEVAEIESVPRASGSLNQKLLDEVDRLRALTICGCGDHFNAAFRGLCPNCVAAGKVAP